MATAPVGTVPPAITSFTGDYAFLSNFYAAPILIEDITYPDNEHYFQCCKTASDRDWRLIFEAPSAAQAKKLGRQVQIREDWDRVKRQCMLSACLAKFSQHPDLRDALTLTGDTLLVEGNRWGDTYWGSILVNGSWQGWNYLGKILMATRMVLC
jgi:ribA/ribD-fused uncharacterized protein